MTLTAVPAVSSYIILVNLLTGKRLIKYQDKLKVWSLLCQKVCLRGLRHIESEV